MSGANSRQEQVPVPAEPKWTELERSLTDRGYAEVLRGSDNKL